MYGNRCENCGGKNVTMAPHRVDAEEQAELVNDGHPIFGPKRKGIEDLEAEADGDEVVMTVQIDQEAYKTHNYFKHRNDLEAGRPPGSSGTITIVIGGGGAALGGPPKDPVKVFDVDDGVVEILRPVEWYSDSHRGYRCRNCGHEWVPALEEVDEDEEVTDDE